MAFALKDKWLWDSWYVQDGSLYHGFFLQADKSIGDPEMRHWNVSYAHATSRDLWNWDHLGTCFGPSAGPAWDDLTTWTGSVVRGDDGLWHLFYTGTCKAEDGRKQRLGHAISEDLHNWTRVGDGQILDLQPPYEEFREGHWHDRAFRDPWVMRDPDGEGWLLYFTARKDGCSDKLKAGAIGLASSPDLYTWTLQDPVFVGGFGELEVPQVIEVDGAWYCLFCTGARHWSEDAIDLLGTAKTGTHYLVGDSARGPWRIAPPPMLDGAEVAARYAARIVSGADGTMNLLGFKYYDRPGGDFIGEISDPQPVIQTSDRLLALGPQETDQGGT